MNKPLQSHGLIPGLTFDAFVSGKANKTAYEAARTVAETDDGRFSPLYICGDQGLGKTHLMHAIGHASLANDPDIKIRAVSSECFVAELIDAIRRNTYRKFRQRYLELDILLIDDISFLAGKERSTEEFVEILRPLIESGRQVVLAADLVPGEIAGIDESVQPLVASGLIVRIGSPDIETRLRILDVKARQYGATLTIDVALLIIDVAVGNVRELEGALRRVLAYASFEGVPVTLDSARRALMGMVRGT